MPDDRGMAQTPHEYLLDALKGGGTVIPEALREEVRRHGEDRHHGFEEFRGDDNALYALLAFLSTQRGVPRPPGPEPRPEPGPKPPKPDFPRKGKSYIQKWGEFPSDPLNDNVPITEAFSPEETGIYQVDHAIVITNADTGGGTVQFVDTWTDVLGNPQSATYCPIPMTTEAATYAPTATISVLAGTTVNTSIVGGTFAAGGEIFASISFDE